MHVKLTSLTNVLASGNGIQYFTLFLLEIHVVYIEFHELFQIDADGYLQIARLISTKFLYSPVQRQCSYDTIK